MNTITMNLSTLTPAALATICAALTKDAQQAYELGSNDRITLVHYAQDVEEALIANVGEEDAKTMLVEAGAIPEWLFAYAPAWHHSFVVDVIE